MKEILLCKYGEILLKGANKRYFEDTLTRELLTPVEDAEQDEEDTQEGEEA